uniref:Uncharacterized protein n=1 Tax=Homo sapiens TaxID=9606 RepID=Q9HAZ8_HUMAN|nr:unknown [Homo sapiens]
MLEAILGPVSNSLYVSGKTCHGSRSVFSSAK